MNEYQKEALKTANSPQVPLELYHLTLGLVGESGEIAEKIKKLIRDRNGDEADLDREDLKKELGDVLWYLAVMSNYLGFDLQSVADANIAKLADRAKRNVINGSGDNR